MGLTVSEKEHFKKRVQSRVADLTADLKSKDPAWKRDLQKLAVEQLEEHFGVQELMQQLIKLRQKREQLDSKIAEVSQEIVSQMTGNKPEDLPTMADQQRAQNRYSYGNAELRDHFKRYPGEASKLMQDYSKRQLKALVAAHPVGAKLKELEELRMDFEDRITTAGTHNQLNAVWQEIQERLGVFVEETGRLPRRVSTARAEREQEEREAAAKA
jgi:hypothetical protein